MLGVGALPGVRLFRNSVGTGWHGEAAGRPAPGLLLLRDPRPVTFGLCPSSPDLIGWRTVTITADMVGQPVAVFAGVEVKAARGRVAEGQSNFHARLREAGGICGVARNVEEAKSILGCI